MRNMRRRIDRAFVALLGACAGLVAAVLAGVIGAIVYRGAPAISWRFLTEQIALVGASGGIFYNIVGTAILVATAAAVCTPLAVALALLHRVYLPAGRWRGGLEVLLYLLNGVPAILFGLIGLIVFVHGLGWGKSWLVGGLVLGLMILPTVAVSLSQRMAAVPRAFVEAAAGLGLSRGQIVRSVILRQSVGGLVTGLLIGLARAAGETAPILFTATIFAGATWPQGVREAPVLSLPYHIFVLAQDSFNRDAAAKAWGAAAVLLMLVLGLSLLALPARLRQHEEARHD